MKYLLLIPTLMLLGAGCAKPVEPITPPPFQIDENDEGGEEAMGEFEDNKMVVKTDDGSEITFKTPNETKIDEDGVPITDIVLGGTATNINMESGNFFFTPKTIEAKPGEKIQISFTKNVGTHTFVIDEINLKHTIKAGEGLSFSAPTKPGSYAFYCDIGSHRVSGMKGMLIVK